MSALAGIDDRQAPMAQGHATVPHRQSLRSPNTFVIAAAMLDRLEHRSDVLFGVAATLIRQFHTYSKRIHK